MFAQELKELGLTDNEIKVYLTLLEFGALNPTNLAQKTGLHRSYIYDTLERLLERGVVNTLLVNKKKHYQPTDPKVLKETFELKLHKINTLLPQLTALFNENKQETHIELHKGSRVFRTLIKDLLSSAKKNDQVYLLGVNEEILESVEPIYIKQYFTIIKELNIKEKVIIQKGSKQVKHKNIIYKTLDSSFFDETTTVIFQNKTYIFIWGKPYHLIVIEDQKVANTYKKQFEYLWKIAQPCR